MKKHLLTVVFVLGLSAAVALAQAGAGAAGSAQTPSGGNYPAGAAAPDQAGQNAPMSEQQPGMSQGKSKKESSMANVDDETLHRQVHEQLASNPDLQNVQITVKNGVVTLDGTVPKKEDRKEAKKLAKSVPGVKSVKEHLTVNASATAAAPSSTGGVSGTASTTGTENPPSSQTSSGAMAGQTGATSSTTGTTSGAATSTETGQTSAGASTSAPSSSTGMGQTSAGASTSAPSTSGMGQTSAGSTATSTASPCSSFSSQSGQAGASTQTGATGAATSGDVASQIQSQICQDPTLASSNISVSQSGNQIILSGTVPSTDIKDKASDIAMRYANGVSVVNNIQVSGQAGAPPSAAGGISGSVGGAAPSSSSSAGAGVGASTSGAAPSVSGQAGVGAQTPESGAAGATSGTAGTSAGAAGTTSSQTSSGMSSADDQLKTQIETALRQEPTLSNDNINVNLSADQVELSGTVANGKDRQTAKRIAESFAGNRKVVDHLTVSGQGSSNVPPEKK